MSGKAVNGSGADPEKVKVAAMNHFDGKADLRQSNEAAFMAVGTDRDNEIVAMTYIGKNGDVKQESNGGVKMMVVGASGDDLKQSHEAFKEIAGDKIKVVIQVQEQEKPFEKKLPPTKTVGDVCRLICKEYNIKKYFEIKRGKEISALDDDTTLAQAARDGSTVNLIAVEA